VIVEETNLMSLAIKFYFTSYMLDMFRTLIHPSSGACDFSIVSPHWPCVLVSMCVGVSVSLGWGGIRVVSRLLSPTMDNNQRLAGWVGGGILIHKREIFQSICPEYAT